MKPERLLPTEFDSDNRFGALVNPQSYPWPRRSFDPDRGPSGLGSSGISWNFMKFQDVREFSTSKLARAGQLLRGRPDRSFFTNLKLQTLFIWFNHSGSLDETRKDGEDRISLRYSF